MRREGSYYFFFSSLTALSVFLTIASLTPVCARGDEGLKRVEVNNSAADAYLAVGLWSWIVPADVDGDGLTDLTVSCEDVPYNGAWYFRNKGDDPIKPTFEKPKRLSRGVINVQPSWVDGKLRVLTPGLEYPDFLNSGVDKPIPLTTGNEPLPNNVHRNKVRGNMWRLVDYDGDGLVDIIVGSDDWTDYGWDDAYNAEGVWQNGPLRGNIYYLRNISSNESPRYDSPVMLTDVDGNALETFGWPNPNFADWDGDGDLDILGIEFRDTFQYSENVGTREEPRYKPFEALAYEDGSPVAAELAMPTIVAYDWNQDGSPDVLLGDEDGRVALFLNKGKTRNGKPDFEFPFYFKQDPDVLKCGALSTPFGVDWDDDGDWDLICGNSAGYVFFIENLSGPGVDPPKWATPKRLCCSNDADLLSEARSVIPAGATLVELRRDGTTPIRIMAGPNGSIQGPCEPKWGYTTLTVADWDGDGLKDVIFNSILGNVFWCKNVGKRGAPSLDVPRPVEVEWDGAPPKLAWGWRFPKGKELLTQWRTTPVAIDWNYDGLTDLVMLDVEGYLAFFKRYLSTDGELKLASPQRVFVDAAGAPLRFSVGRAGASGRRKLCVVDYNRDGKLDILANGLNADLYLQTKAEDGKYYFTFAGQIDSLPIKGHSTSPTVVDFDGDGVMDPFIGAEDGHFYYKRNDWRADQSSMIRFESDLIRVESVLNRSTLRSGSKAFANRDYVWLDVDESLEGREYLQTSGGSPADVNVVAKEDATIEFLVGLTWPLRSDASDLTENDLKTFDAVVKKRDVVKYTDAGKSPLTLLEKKLSKGETWRVPIETWSGSLILLPKE